MKPTTTRTSRTTSVSPDSVSRLRPGRRNRLRTPYSHGNSRRPSMQTPAQRTHRQTPTLKARGERPSKARCNARCGVRSGAPPHRRRSAPFQFADKMGGCPRLARRAVTNRRKGRASHPTSWRAARNRGICSASSSPVDGKACPQPSIRSNSSEHKQASASASACSAHARRSTSPAEGPGPGCRQAQEIAAMRFA